MFGSGRLKSNVAKVLLRLFAGSAIATGGNLLCHDEAAGEMSKLM
jgi:hypothetical protein